MLTMTTRTNQENDSDNVTNLARIKEIDTRQNSTQQPAIRTLLQITLKPIRIENQVAEMRTADSKCSPTSGECHGLGS
jgi:hypothetical protein